MQWLNIHNIEINLDIFCYFLSGRELNILKLGLRNSLKKVFSCLKTFKPNRAESPPETFERFIFSEKELKKKYFFTSFFKNSFSKFLTNNQMQIDESFKK